MEAMAPSAERVCDLLSPSFAVCTWPAALADARALGSLHFVSLARSLAPPHADPQPSRPSAHGWWASTTPATDLWEPLRRPCRAMSARSAAQARPHPPAHRQTQPHLRPVHPRAMPSCRRSPRRRTAMAGCRRAPRSSTPTRPDTGPQGTAAEQAHRPPRQTHHRTPRCISTLSMTHSSPSRSPCTLPARTTASRSADKPTSRRYPRQTTPTLTQKCCPGCTPRSGARTTR